jgi:4-hydroxybutyryl-CoA dehydratase/vinylacetyl-CoA-Delta-isomerase
MPQRQRASRINALARQVKAADPKDIDIEDIAQRAWPDAKPEEESAKSSAQQQQLCSSCGPSGCGSHSSGLSANAVAAKPNAVASPMGAVEDLSLITPMMAHVWPKDKPVTMPEIRTAEDYVASLRNRNVKVILQGEYVTNFVDHPIVWPTVNSLAETYRFGVDTPELGTAIGFSGHKMSRFLHICESADDLVKQSRMQRELGRRTGCCFQRCVGMDAINAMWATTYDIDQKHGTPYHQRFQEFMRMAQSKNIVIGGAMTDPKGDRSLNPGQQEDPDLFVHVHERRPDGSVTLRGAKCHQTGTLNSHWMIVMPGGRLEESEKDYAIACAVPVDAEGLTYIYGRQSCDLRAMDGSDIDQGNANFGAQETVIGFEDVVVPKEYIFMEGEIEFTTSLVERFTAFHRRSYICKAGLGDVMLGAAATVSDYNGTAKASHVKDKFVEIAYLNENIAGTALAASYGGKAMPAGNYLPEVMMANICKHNVTRFPYEIARMVQDLAGGLMSTLPGDREFKHSVAGPLLEKYLKAKKGVTMENRRRILRLIECMTMGRNAIGYLSESMHGAGSPQAQRVLIARLMDINQKKTYAKRLAGIKE